MAGGKSRDDRDRMDGPKRATAPRVAPAFALPVAEPAGASFDAQRQALCRSIEELEQVFRFMGTGHPEHARTRERLEQLRAILAELERAG